MRRILGAVTVCLAISAGACSRDSDDSAVSNNVDVSAGNSAIAMDAGNESSSAPTAPTEFAAMIAGGDMYEIESGKMAQSKASNQALKDFGAMLVAQHTKSSADLKSAAASTSPPITLPTAVPAEHQAHLDELKAADKNSFDQLFVKQQVEAHQKALTALNAYAAGGDSPSLKAFAAKAVGVVQSHLDKLKAMGS
jgi:putative membrane protein